MADAIGNILRFRAPQEDWRALMVSCAADAGEEEKNKAEAEVKTAKEALKNALLTSLQMQNIVVLAGSGASQGKVGGPTMADLWNECTKETKSSEPVLKKVQHPKDDKNIENFLSRCEGYLQFNSDAAVEDFVRVSRSKILTQCSGFLKNENLDGHRTLLHRLARRRVRDSRVKIFTINYDLCFENAASLAGLVMIDGFSFALPRVYDPRYFNYDIVRRSRNGEDTSSYLEGVFHLYKLHGSVNWARSQDGDSIIMKDAPEPSEVCLIYPASGKYRQTYSQPHLELFAQYLASLREPNTCFIVTGFGFNDEHIAEPILSAVKTNPHLRLLLVDPYSDSYLEKKYWKELYALSSQGEDIWFINAAVADFANLIPDLKSLTPAERLAKDVKTMVD